VHGKNKMRWYADWIRQQVAKMGVQIRYKTTPTAQDLAGFDAVLVATGAAVVKPDIKGINSKRVCTFEDVLRCAMKNCEYWPKGGKQPPAETGETVLIWGDHFGAADAAEKLGYEGKKVIIVTENREFAQWLEPCHRDVMMKRFKGGNGEGLTSKTFAHPVTIIPSSSVLEIRDNGEVVIVNSKFERSVLMVDTVVVAAMQANDSLYAGYAAAGLVVARIGDAKKVRNLRGAVTDGANLGLSLDKDLRLNPNLAVVADLPTDVRL